MLVSCPVLLPGPPGGGWVGAACGALPAEGSAWGSGLRVLGTGRLGGRGALGAGGLADALRGSDVTGGRGDGAGRGVDLGSRGVDGGRLGRGAAGLGAAGGGAGGARPPLRPLSALPAPLPGRRGPAGP